MPTSFPWRISKILAISLSVIMVLSLYRSPMTSAQALPSELGFLCEPYNSTLETVSCSLMVPADTIGAELEITVPNSVNDLINIEKGPYIPLTAVLFPFEIIDQGSTFLINVGFAELTTQAFSSVPYALFTFDISFDPALTAPKLIITNLEQGSKLVTPDSLDTNSYSFEAGTGISMEINIDAICGDSTQQVGETCDDGNNISGDDCSATCQDETIPPPPPPPPPPPGGGGFIPGGGGGGGGFIPGGGGGGGSAIPTGPSTCFDDDPSVMTAEEWNIVCRAMRRGIISGNPTANGTFFYPDKAINRAEVSKILTLGILTHLGKLSDRDFDSVERAISGAYPGEQTIIYNDIRYDNNGAVPWFAKYVAIASIEGIFSGYMDGSFRAAKNINNAESYKVIVETARVASESVQVALHGAAEAGVDEAWFVPYALTLQSYGISFSEDYSKITRRLEFLIIIMDLLKAAGANI